jgi:hypothetical protein
MKKILSLILITSSIFFSSCGGSDAENADASLGTLTEKIGYKVYENSSFTMLYPMDWEIMTQDQFTSSAPASAVVAFTNNVQNEIFTASLGVTARELAVEVSSSDFAKSSLESQREELVDFVEVDSEQVNITDEISTHILTFDGRSSTTGPNVRFKQLHVVDGTVVYSLTAAFLPTEEQSVVKHIDEMLDSFTLK